MGLGPRSTSLLERLGRPTEPGGDTLWIQIDQQERGEARMQARMRYQQKHKTPKKPEAPVEPANYQAITDPSKKLGYRKERLWLWVGKSIESKGMLENRFYLASEIRAAGFKLPWLEKKLKKAKVKE